MFLTMHQSSALEPAVAKPVRPQHVPVVRINPPVLRARLDPIPVCATPKSCVVDAIVDVGVGGCRYWCCEGAYGQDQAQDLGSLWQRRCWQEHLLVAIGSDPGCWYAVLSSAMSRISACDTDKTQIRRYRWGCLILISVGPASQQ
jgi:hypothetical protein